MATSYPGGIDSFNNPTQSTAEDAEGYEHDLQHSDVNDALEAIETELGTNPSGSYTDVAARLDDMRPPEVIWTPVGTPVWSDEFDGTIDPAWVRADAAGTADRVTWTQSNGCLSMRHDGTGAAEGASTHYLLYPLSSAGGSFAAGDAIVIGYNGAHTGWNPQYVMANAGLSNGTTHGTSSAVCVQFYTTTSQDHQMRAWTNTSMTTDGAQSGTAVQQHGGFYYRRLVMTAANTWRADFSPDGISWLPVATPGAISYTLTPTHIALGGSTWTTAYPFIHTFYFVRRYSGVS